MIFLDQDIAGADDIFCLGIEKTNNANVWGQTIHTQITDSLGVRSVTEKGSSGTVNRNISCLG